MSYVRRFSDLSPLPDGSKPLDPSTFAPDRRPANVKPSPFAGVALRAEPPIRCPWSHEPWSKNSRKAGRK